MVNHLDTVETGPCDMHGDSKHMSAFTSRIISGTAAPNTFAFTSFIPRIINGTADNKKNWTGPRMIFTWRALKA